MAGRMGFLNGSAPVLVALALIVAAGIIVYSTFYATRPAAPLGTSGPAPGAAVTATGGYSGKMLAGRQSAPLLEFVRSDYDEAVKSDGLVVLYFYANWCPICKREIPELYSAFNELDKDGVVGFRVNFDDSDTDGDETNLAREFGVAYQHTKVFLKSGRKILKSPETWDRKRYLEEINAGLAG